MVVMEEGKPRPAHYRRFRIKTVQGADDYAMMQEVLRRRFKRIKAEASGGSGDTWAVVPDLVLIDGGKGQLNAAVEAMQELEVKDVPLAGLAKEHEEIFLPGRDEPIRLPASSAARQLLQRLRDEAHRFALGYHLKVRQKSAMKSALDSIPGIGPGRKRALIRRFGSARGIKEVSLDQIAATEGMSISLAERVKDLL
jgi:excinuclease ABC subunit C